MQTLDHLREMFAYNEWANRRILDALRSNGNERCVQILAHLLVTEQEYLERIAGGRDSTGFNFWPVVGLDQMAASLASVAEAYRERLTDEASLDRSATYKTSEGVEYTNTWRELLAHVLFHSSIHRGNVMLKLRESGIAPPTIDYIIYLREA